MNSSITARQIRTNIYRKTDVAGWSFSAAGLIALAAGAFVTRNEMLALRQPEAATALFVFFAMCAGLFLFFALQIRLLISIVTTPYEIILKHGLWRFHIPWQHVSGVSEWSSLRDSAWTRWIALWSADGTKLQIRENAAQDFQQLRSDILRRVALNTPTPRETSDLAAQFMATETSKRPAEWMFTAAGYLLYAGLIVWFALQNLSVWSEVCFAVAAIFGLYGLYRWNVHSEITINRDGIGMKRGLMRTFIAWNDIYDVQRNEGERSHNIFATIGRTILMLIIRISRKTGFTFGSYHTGSKIIISGGSGVSIKILENRFEHPEWIRARLRAEIDALTARAASASASARVIKPLAKTGPLEKTDMLPPEPTEGGSALWLRESFGYDPYKNNS